MRPDKAAWLQATREHAIDADQPIIDPHHHLWDRSGSRYLVDDLRRDTGAGHRIVATVYVECLSAWRADGPPALRPVGETEFATAQAGLPCARGEANIAAIVAHADLALGAAVEPVLLAHEQAGQGLFRGIRHPAARDPDLKPGHIPAPAGLFDSPGFREGFATLGRLGYSFDAWLFHPQLIELIRLAQAVPEVPVVLDHLGAPLGVGRFVGRRAEVRERWRADLVQLARLPQVVVKLGGIGMDRCLGGGWPSLDSAPGSAQLYDYWADDLRWCIDQFGPTRCMFESNFPVDRESCSYTVLWNTFQRVGMHYTAAERHALFFETAARVYRIDPARLSTSSATAGGTATGMASNC